MYVIEKAPLENVEEQFKMALDMAGSDSQKLKILNDIEDIMLKVQGGIDVIYEYYKLPKE